MKYKTTYCIMHVKKCDLLRKNLCYVTFVVSIIFFITSMGFICFVSAFATPFERKMTEDKTYHIQQHKIIDKLRKLENKVNNNKNRIKRYRKGNKGD